MNPRAGAGPPSVAELVAHAKRLGIEAQVLGPRDRAAELAREAASRSAGALGVAGGDGTLAGVAAVAVESRLPFVPVPFGTRNHFARDVGFDPADPLGALAAFRGGTERLVDVGLVGDRAFLNNVSLGIYASLVHHPGRETKNRVVALARMLQAAFGRSRRRLDVSFEVDARVERHRALVVLVANNDYDASELAAVRERRRLDEGRLHAYVVEAAARRTLVALLARAAAGRLERATGWTEYAASSFRVDSTRPRIHAAVDGEPVILHPPLDFAIRPRSLRVLTPPETGDGARPETDAG